MTRRSHAVQDCPVPRSSQLSAYRPAAGLRHATGAPLPPGAPDDADYWAGALFNDPPSAMRALIRARDVLARALRLHTVIPGKPDGHQDRVGPFPVIERAATEVVFGLDDKHLDFRSSVQVEHPECAADSSSAVRPRVTVSTVAQAHNTFGRLYLLPVRVAHPLLLRLLLRRALARTTPNSPTPPGTPPAGPVREENL
ncbi:DUF2867 domain-containing protein [Streptomyces apocyni]|uniref:DUF2867 domain-containing protein n=1 Tax=Streptomyces apocyni TaxID=2654677 RepID=UPI0012EB04EF|nr:DUF2867 domain-containing protein [Streptomyces apocyni]